LTPDLTEREARRIMPLRFPGCSTLALFPSAQLLSLSKPLPLVFSRSGSLRSSAKIFGRCRRGKDTLRLRSLDATTSSSGDIGVRKELSPYMASCAGAQSDMGMIRWEGVDATIAVDTKVCRAANLAVEGRERSRE
jgi:hypothetical protein